MVVEEKPSHESGGSFRDFVRDEFISRVPGHAVSLFPRAISGARSCRRRNGVGPLA